MTMGPTQRETVSIPSNDYVSEGFAASIFGWTMQQLHYQQSWNGAPLPARGFDVAVISTAELVRWAKSRQFNIKRYTI